METSIQPRIDRYLELLNQIKSKVHDEKIAMNLLVELSKDARMEQMRKEKGQQASEPASRKQIDYLENLGIDTTKYPNLTKQQASKLIDEALLE